MSSFTLSHPRRRGTSASYGIDHALGFFVEITKDGDTLAEYDRLHAGYADLEGALRFLVEHGFFSEVALCDAKIWLADRGGEGRVSSAVHRAATVVCNFKEWTPPA